MNTHDFMYKAQHFIPVCDLFYSESKILSVTDNFQESYMQLGGRTKRVIEIAALCIKTSIYSTQTLMAQSLEATHQNQLLAIE